MRRTIIATTALAAATLTGCSATSTSVNTTPAATSAATSQAAAKASAATTSAAPKKAGIGDTLDIDGSQPGDVLQVTVTKVVDPAPAKDEFLTPDPGKRFVAIRIKIVNKGHAVYSDDPQADVKAKDAAGEDMELAFGGTAAGADMPSSVDLSPGDSQLGYVAFSVPNGQKITQVQYALVALGGDHVAQWTIG